MVLDHAHWLAVLATAPLYLTYRTYKVYLGRIDDEQRHVREMADLHLATIEALALAIDAKDQTSQSHIRRVQLYATAVARALGMKENEIQGVKTAALLHDIGKLAVPEHILSKPGPLTPEEFQKIRAHPKVGADIVSSVPFPYPVAPLILSHHERWDGKGYPSGLKGEEIPLGARILSVVDYFDALMAERPYHKAMSFEAAIGLLQQEAGKGLDPTVVNKFIELLPALQAEAAKLEQSMRKPVPAARADAWPAGDRPHTGAVEEERLRRHRAGAPRDLRALRDRPGDGDQPRRVGHDGAHLGEVEQPGAVLLRRPVPLRRGGGNAALPVRDGHGRRHHPAGHGEVRRRADRLGGAQPPSARQCAAERRSRGRRPEDRDAAAVGARLPAALQRAVHRNPVGLSRRRRVLPRRPPPAARPRLRAGGRGHQQLDAVRADAGRLADRPAHRAPEHALPVHAPDARAGACRAAEVRAVADGDGPGSLQGDQRQPRPPRRRPGAVRGRARPARRDPSLRHLRALRRRRVHRGPVRLQRGRGGTEAPGAAAGRRRGVLRGAPGQAAAARHQRRHGGVPARRRILRVAARDRGQPDVSGQGEPQAAQRPHRLAWPISTARRAGVACRALGYRHPAGRSGIV